MNFLKRIFATACFLMLALGTADAIAERRVALVIGNATYQHTAALRNPHHDAEDMAAALKRLGFTVVEGLDLDKRSMERTIRQFGTKLAGADIALFFYAGHGIQIAGQNYLLPTDARLSSEGDTDFEAIALGLVLKQMEREVKTSLLLLDACRDNPLARNLARTMGTRSSLVAQGLAEVKTGVGTLIGFSTQPGNVALDGGGRNSPYAAALLRNIEARDVDISSMLINVRGEVVAATNGQQVPWEHTSLMGRVVFSESAPQPSGQAGQPTATANYDKEMEIAFWNAIKDSKTPALLQTYLNRFPNGTFAELAKVLIEQVGKEQQAAPPEDARREASAAHKEAAASVTASPANPLPLGGGPIVETPAALVRSIQSELRRLGCEPGKEDGQWGPNVREAVERFNKAKSTSHATEAPKRETLAALAGASGRVCPLRCGRNEEIVDGECTTKVQRPAAPRERQSLPQPASSSERSRVPSRAQPEHQDGAASSACAQWRRCVAVGGRGNEGRCGLSPRGC